MQRTSFSHLSFSTTTLNQPLKKYLNASLLYIPGSQKTFSNSTSTKKNAIFVSTKSRIKALPKIVNIAGQNIKISSEIKLLGVLIDKTLSFDQNISSTAKQCSIHIKAINHIRKCLIFQTAHNLALALIISRLNYCNYLLYSLPSTLIRKLQKIKNHIARVVLNCDIFTPSTKCLDKLHWLPIPKRLIFKIAALTYNCHHSKTPGYLYNLTNNRNDLSSLRSKNSPFYQPVGRTKYFDRSFSHAAPSIWNGLPNEINTFSPIIQINPQDLFV